MTDGNKLRTLMQVSDDMLWPEHGIFGPDPTISRRHAALAEVLCRIPEPDYKKIVNIVDEFQWFIPPLKQLGLTLPFHMNSDDETAEWMTGRFAKTSPFAMVAFLNPLLEYRAYDIVVAVVVHELAHVFLKHKLYTTPELYRKQEEEVHDLVFNWGFEKETKKADAMWKREETIYKQQMIELNPELLEGAD